MMALFSTFGYLLMILGKVVPFGPFSFLEIEISDLTVLLAYSFIGYFPSLLVAIVKTLLAALTFGFVGVPIPIGQITALISSFFYATFLLLLDKTFHLAKQPLSRRIISYCMMGLIISLILTFLNFLFITPTFMTFGAQFLTYFDIFNAPEDSQLLITFNEYFGALNASYTGAIFGIYIPFNLLKAVLILILYEVLYFKALVPFIRSQLLISTLSYEKFTSITSYRKLRNIQKADKTPLFISYHK